MLYEYEIPRNVRLGAREDWRFVIPDLRDASGVPLDTSGYRLRLQFRPTSLRGLLIGDLQEGSGISVTANMDLTLGPTITILSRAVDRTWFPVVDTPVVGDLMMYRGVSSDKDSVLLQRIAFVATWNVTRDD